jgi:hypothetical protein
MTSITIDDVDHLTLQAAVNPPRWLVLKSHEQRTITMRTLMIAVTVGLSLAAGAHTASAGNESDKAVGAGSYIHPTGPANGVWHQGGK